MQIESSLYFEACYQVNFYQLTGEIVMNNDLKKLTALVGASLAASLAVTQANANPFALTDMDQGYEIMQGGDKDKEGKCGEGKCGEGKCGEDKKTKKEGKCGEGKCGEGKCGEDKKTKKEGKCGEGKCGEGKCGEDKKTKKEGKCGEGKCGGIA